MRNRFDLLGKQLGQKALALSGPTVLQDEIPAEVQYADLRHEPAPARAAERARLGLLGRIASRLCLIELYGHAPSGAELRACLCKHLTFWQARTRKRRGRKARERRRQAAAAAPSLWIIAAGTPRTLLAKLKLEPAPGWPPGVYRFGADVLRVGLIVANELPRDPSTLLVRLMAGGALLPQAIAELHALPEDAHERTVAEEILLRFHHALEKKPRRTPEEQEFIVTMYTSWAQIREEGRKQGEEQGRKQGEEQGRKQGEEQGRKQGEEQGLRRGLREGQKKGRELGQKQGQRQGRLEALASAVLTVLRARGIRVPSAARRRILAEQHEDRLERWLARASVERSVAAVLGDPS